MKDIKLVNILKETVVEMYPHEGASDVATVEFGRANVWSKFDRPINVYFNELSKSPSEISNSSKIVLTDKKSGDDYIFDADDIRIQNDKMWISVRDLRELYPRFLETLLVKDDKVRNENLNVNTLKTKASGIPQLILDVLKEVYPNNWGKISEPDCQTLEGVIDIFPAMEGERWSILNFFDTNPGVIRILVEKYQDENDEVTLEGFKDFLRDNKEELFGKDSPILQSLVKRNLQSFERGWKTEAEVIDIVKRENPTLTDEDISQYCLGSVEDRVSGVDFKVKGKGYQTKPASKMERLKNGGVRVQTYGMRDWYQRKKEIDYILYSNGKSIAVFPNKNYKVSNDGKTVTHYENIAKGTFG